MLGCYRFQMPRSLAAALFQTVLMKKTVRCMSSFRASTKSDAAVNQSKSTAILCTFIIVKNPLLLDCSSSTCHNVNAILCSLISHFYFCWFQFFWLCMSSLRAILNCGLFTIFMCFLSFSDPHNNLLFLGEKWRRCFHTRGLI